MQRPPRRVRARAAPLRPEVIDGGVERRRGGRSAAAAERPLNQRRPSVAGGGGREDRADDGDRRRPACSRAVALEERVAKSEKGAWFWFIGSSWPLQSAHPFGAKTKVMLWISDRKDSAIGLLGGQRAADEAAGPREQRRAADAEGSRGARVQAVDVVLDVGRASWGRRKADDPKIVGPDRRSLLPEVDPGRRRRGRGVAATRGGVAGELEA